jgi:O-acetylserine/cysteine efflux transporter
MPVFHIFLAICVAAVWGGNFVAAKYGLTYFPPFFLSSLRFIMVGIALLPFLPKVGIVQIKRIAILSFTLGTLHLAMLFYSMHLGLNIASTAILSQMGVPFACILSAIFLNDKLGKWRTGGMVIAFIGIIIVSGSPNAFDHMAGTIIALLAAFFWGVANLLMKNIGPVNIFRLLAWLSLFTAPQLLLVSYLFENGQIELLMNVPVNIAWSVAYTAFVSTIVGYGLWYYLMARYQMTQVAPFSLLVPIFSIAFGKLFFSEALPLQTLLGGAIAILGVAVIIIRRPKLALLGEGK